MGPAWGLVSFGGVVFLAGGGAWVQVLFAKGRRFLECLFLRCDVYRKARGVKEMFTVGVIMELRATKKGDAAWQYKFAVQRTLHSLTQAPAHICSTAAMSYQHIPQHPQIQEFVSDTKSSPSKSNPEPSHHNYCLTKHAHARSSCPNPTIRTSQHNYPTNNPIPPLSSLIRQPLNSIHPPPQTFPYCVSLKPPSALNFPFAQGILTRRRSASKTS